MGRNEKDKVNGEIGDHFVSEMNGKKCGNEKKVREDKAKMGT